MIDLERLEEDIEEFLDDIYYEGRFFYRIVLREDLKYDFTKEQMHEFTLFSLHETNKPLHFTPFITDDLVVVNSSGPNKDLKSFRLEDYKI